MLNRVEWTVEVHSEMVGLFVFKRICTNLFSLNIQLCKYDSHDNQGRSHGRKYTVLSLQFSTGLLIVDINCFDENNYDKQCVIV